MSDPKPTAKPAPTLPPKPAQDKPAQAPADPGRGMRSLQSIAAILEAAMEHVPPTTRKILEDSANVHLRVLQETVQKPTA